MRKLEVVQHIYTYKTAVTPRIYGLAFIMGKWFLTDNSATVGRILMISRADSHKNFDFDKMLKKSAF